MTRLKAYSRLFFNKFYKTSLNYNSPCKCPANTNELFIFIKTKSDYMTFLIILSFDVEKSMNNVQYSKSKKR